jgi:predicted ester cyclase
MADVERNIDTVRRVEEAYAARDYDTLRTLIVDDLSAHTPGSELMPAGIDGAIAANEGGFGFYPDKQVRINSLFGEGDRTVAHMTMSGTNTGQPIGFLGLTEPTGRSVVVDWIQIARHDDQGKIAETWAQMDVPAMMAQLGLMPAPEEA